MKLLPLAVFETKRDGKNDTPAYCAVHGGGTVYHLGNLQLISIAQMVANQKRSPGAVKPRKHGLPAEKMLPSHHI